MTFRHAAIIVFAVICCTPFCMAQSEPDVVAKLVKDYFEAKNAPQERRTALEKLKKANPLYLSRPLQKMISDQESRSDALNLAISFRVPGLFNSCKNLIDTKDEALITELLFLTQDKGSASFLFNRWKKADIDGASFSILQSGFTKHGFEASLIDDFYGMLSNEKYAKYVAPILKFQMGLETNDPDKIRKNWKEYRSLFVSRYGVIFKNHGGVDLMGLPDWTFKETRRVGQSFHVNPKGVLESPKLPVSTVGRTEYAIILWVYVLSGDGADIVFDNGSGSPLRLIVNGDDWIVNTSGGRHMSKCRKEQWTEVRFEISEAACVNVFVDGEDFTPETTILVGSGVPILRFSGGEGGLIVNGVELAKASKQGKKNK